MASTAPLIALSACVREIGIHPFHVVGEKYLTAVRDGAGGFPLMLPSLAEDGDAAEILQRVDGLMFTGSPMWSRIIMTGRRARPTRCTTPSAIPSPCR